MKSVEDISSEADLIAIADALLEGDARRPTAGRASSLGDPARPGRKFLESIIDRINAGDDPLGEAFCRLRSPQRRRIMGATYTPRSVVATMADWAAREHLQPARVVDMGAGSGRFSSAVASRFPLSHLVAVEIDPVAAGLARANATVLGYAHRQATMVADYRDVTLPSTDGTTLFIGNPPYVRHHEIPKDRKAWLTKTASRFGLRASKLAGLHVHFFLRTLEIAKPGDYGILITSAEWLDVNYGSLVRSLLAGPLGAKMVQLVDPRTAVFANAATTSVICGFRVGGTHETITMGCVSGPEALADLDAGKAVARDIAGKARRWTDIIKGSPAAPKGYIELGEIFRVHRGQVTGGNAVWIAGAAAAELPERFLYPAVTRARELIAAGEALKCERHLRRVVDLPIDLEALDADDRAAVDSFLDWARRHDADKSYIARNRRAWWSVGLREPAPVLCTYMARRPPAFVRNLCGARHLNIAHGLYPRGKLEPAALGKILAYLRTGLRGEGGRTYAGGLIKYEPREIERLFVPAPA